MFIHHHQGRGVIENFLMVLYMYTCGIFRYFEDKILQGTWLEAGKSTGIYVRGEVKKV